MSGLVTSASLMEDGKTALTASRDSTLRIWDVATARTLHTLAGHSDAVLKVALSSSGRHAASLGRDRTIRLWDLVNGRAIRALAAEDNLKVLTSRTSDPFLLELGQHLDLDVTPNPINRDAEVTISPDGRYVLIGDDSGVLCWDALTGRSLKEKFDDFIVVAMTTGLPGRAILESRTGWIKVWDLEVCATTQTFKAHDRQVLDLVVNADQQRLVSAGRDNTIRVWDTARMTLIGTLHGASAESDEVAVAPDGRVAYSIYGDTIVAFDLIRFSRLGSLSFDHNITAVAVASDGMSVAAGDESGAVHFLTLDNLTE
jgi:WD40 repeat protein